MALSRRQLLIGGLGLGALAGLLGPGLARAAAARRVVVWWNGGGWDTSYVFDPHFELGEAIDRDPYSEQAEENGIAFADAASRPSVRAFFESWGASAVVVNGIAVDSISHETCATRMLTGQRTSGSADVGALAASALGPSLAAPYVPLSGPARAGSLGHLIVPANDFLLEALPPQDAGEAAIQAWLQEESQRLGSAGAQDLGRAVGQLGALDGLGELDLEDPVGATIGLLQQGLAACVMTETDVPTFGTWDSHTNNHWNQDACLEACFAQLLQLCEGLQTAGLFQDTLVLVLSEMGRSPRLVGDGGKSHWPVTSALLVGGGLQGGRVLGGTDEDILPRPVDLASGEPSSAGTTLGTGAFLGGVLQLLDVDPTEHFDEAPLSALGG